MRCCIVAVCLLLHSCLGVPCLVPMPSNLTLQSFNFEHLLKWDPGLRTPPGMQYRVNVKSTEKRKTIFSDHTNITAMDLTDVLNEVQDSYNISVRATCENRSSSASFKMFSPWTDTALGPPEVSLEQPESCLLVIVKLPRGRANKSIEDLYFRFEFKVHLKKSGDQKEDVILMAKRNNTICDLETGVEYCVQVHTSLPMNRKMIPTPWKCVLLGDEKLSSAVPIALILLAVALLLLAMVLLGLIYTGYLCKQKIRHPAVLLSPLKSYLPAEFANAVAGKLIVEYVTVSPNAAHQGKPARSLQPPSAESSDEEDEGENQYLNWRGGPLSMSECDEASRSSWSSALPSTTDTSRESSGNSHTAVLSSVEEHPLVSVAAEASGEPEAYAETPAAAAHICPEGSENTVENSVDVNLFSVILGSLEQDKGDGEHLDGPSKVHPLGDSAGAAQGSPGQSRTLLTVASSVETLTDCLVPDVAQMLPGPSLEEEDESQEEEEDEKFTSYMRR